VSAPERRPPGSYIPNQMPDIAEALSNERLKVLLLLGTARIRCSLSVIAATTTPAAPAAKAATTTIPIVFETAADPAQSDWLPTSIGQAATSRA